MTKDLKIVTRALLGKTRVSWGKKTYGFLNFI